MLIHALIDYTHPPETLNVTTTTINALTVPVSKLRHSFFVEKPERTIFRTGQPSSMITSVTPSMGIQEKQISPSYLYHSNMQFNISWTISHLTLCTQILSGKYNDVFLQLFARIASYAAFLLE